LPGEKNGLTQDARAKQTATGILLGHFCFRNSNK